MMMLNVIPELKKNQAKEMLHFWLIRGVCMSGRIRVSLVKSMATMSAIIPLFVDEFVTYYEYTLPNIKYGFFRG